MGKGGAARSSACRGIARRMFHLSPAHTVLKSNRNEEEEEISKAQEGEVLTKGQGKALCSVALATFLVKPAHNGLSCATWLGRGPVSLSTTATDQEALWKKCVVDRLESLGSNSHSTTSSCFTQHNFSSCFCASSLSPLAELHCFTLEGSTWGGILSTHSSLRA